MKVEQDHFMKSKKERNFLYILVDIVWSAANKDESVPSTEHATKLIKKAKEQYGKHIIDCSDSHFPDMINNQLKQ